MNKIELNWTEWLQWQPLVLPSYRGDSRALFMVGLPVRPRTQHDWLVNYLNCTMMDGLTNPKFLKLINFLVFFLLVWVMDVLPTTHLVWTGRSGHKAHFEALSRAPCSLRLFALKGGSQRSLVGLPGRYTSSYHP